MSEVIQRGAEGEGKGDKRSCFAGVSGVEVGKSRFERRGEEGMKGGCAVRGWDCRLLVVA